MEYYVYILVEPVNNLPFYVGKGKGRRAEVHISKSHNRKNNEYINTLSEVGLAPQIKYIRNLDEKTSYEYEEFLISYFGRKNSNSDFCSYTNYPILNNKASGARGSGWVLGKKRSAEDTKNRLASLHNRKCEKLKSINIDELINHLIVNTQSDTCIRFNITRKILLDKLKEHGIDFKEFSKMGKQNQWQKKY